jgi:hypothetical protein
LKTITTPEEIGKAALFLAADAPSMAEGFEWMRE